MSSDGVETSHQVSQQSATLTPATPTELSANYLQLVEPSTGTSDPQLGPGSDTSPQAQGYLELVA